MTWENTYLDNVKFYGGVNPMGGGSYGGTNWKQPTANPSQWANTYLDNVKTYGGVDPMGSGSYGGTNWKVSL